jgi:hypothetical protein
MHASCGEGCNVGCFDVIGLFLALALQSASPPSPEALARIAPVEAAIKSARQAQSQLPPPANDAERLLRMLEVEQAARNAMNTIDLHDLPKPDRDAAFQAMWAPVHAVDAANQASLLQMLPPEGWFYASKYGPEAANAAFLIVQHGNLDLWRRFVPVLEPLVAAREVQGPAYALMFDRLALSEGRPQRYGSQMSCKAGKFVVSALEDPDHVEDRRKAMGFTETLAEYTKHFEHYPPC